MVDQSIVSACSAILGSVVGGLTTFATAWTAQRHQLRREIIAKDLALREALYSEFIVEASKLLMEAIEREFDRTETFVKLFALSARINMTASDEVTNAADELRGLIVESYLGSTQDFRQLCQARKDPLKDFSVACKNELRKLREQG
jgi:hypothetical protein